MSMLRVSHAAFISGTIVLASLVLPGSVRAENVLYSFKGGSDGAQPDANLIADAAGSLYGTTLVGGGSGCEGGGCGTIFKLASDGTESVLYAFQNGNDGAFPDSGLIEDTSGNFYGTTGLGGPPGFGTVFELAANGTETALYTFTGGSDGGVPAGLVGDLSGNLYGTTIRGGTFGGSDCGEIGCGTVFEVSPAGKETVLYTFLGGTDGSQPAGGVIRDRNGNLYGMTSLGGTGNCNGGSYCGTVFKVAPDGTETVLHSFQGGNDGYAPLGALLLDSAGNLYGTTQSGGSGGGYGTVFKLAPDGTETVLYAFKGGRDGLGPVAGVVMDKSGNLYGTTYIGGGTGCKGGGCGTAFKLTLDGTESVLVSFGKGGKYPTASLLLKGDILYGVTEKGGSHNKGVVFKVRK